MTDQISPREQEILKLVSLEKTSEEIAKELFISSHTTNTHRKNLRQKLRVKNTAGLVRRGFELGILKTVAVSLCLILTYFNQLQAQVENGNYNYQVRTVSGTWAANSDDEFLGIQSDIVGDEEVNMKTAACADVNGFANALGSDFNDEIATCGNMFACNTWNLNCALSCQVSMNDEILTVSDASSSKYDIEWRSWEDDSAMLFTCDGGGQGNPTSDHYFSLQDVAVHIPNVWTTIAPAQRPNSASYVYKSAWRYNAGRKLNPLRFGILSAGETRSHFNSNRPPPVGAPLDLGYRSDWSLGLGTPNQSAPDVTYSFRIDGNAKLVTVQFAQGGGLVWKPRFVLLNEAGDVLANQSDPFLAVPDLNINLCEGTYRVVVEGFDSTDDHGNFILTVSAANISLNGGTIAATNSSECEGLSIATINSTEEAQAIDGNAPSYQWQEFSSNSWQDIVGQTGASLASPGTMGDTDRQYRREATICGIVGFSNIVTILTEPGSIESGAIVLSSGSSNVIPGGTDPGSIDNLSLATGMPGPIIYSWEVCTGTNCSNNNNWTEAPGSTNSPSYNMPVITESTRFRRVATNGCNGIGVTNEISIISIEPNGVIEGSILSPAGPGGPGAPIEGVEVTAIRTTTVTGGNLTTDTYKDTTDANGNYLIANIYYGDNEADFTVTPFYDDGNIVHDFDPDNRIVTLQTTPNIRDDIDFTDLTSFRLSGTIYQTFISDQCGMDSIPIKLNGIIMDTTDILGNYDLAIPGAGTYEIEPVFLDHTFVPQGFNSSALTITGDLSGMDFENVTTYQVTGFVGAGCENYLGQADIRFTSEDLCIMFEQKTNINSGNFTVELPARKYNAQVINFDDPDPYRELEVLAFFQNVIEIDLSADDITQDFIYRPEPTIEVLGLPEEVCNRTVLEQLKPYEITIRIWEGPASENCPVDTGYVLINDEISDRNSEEIMLPFSNGEVKYIMQPGNPNISAPYLKNITIVARDMSEQSATWIKDALVTGGRPRNSTFTTVTPEIPLMILRDPPGGASQSWVEQGQSMELATSFFHKEGGSFNIWSKAKVGVEFEIGIGYTTEVSAYGQIGASLEVGGANTTTEEQIISVSTMERFETSGNPEITGTDGDVFIGAAINLIYANTDVIEFDPNTCTVISDVQLMIAPNGFETEYIYTEQHIREEIIKDLELLSATHPNPDSMLFFADQAQVWHQALQRNEELKANAIPSVPFQGNRSFSANTVYSSSTTASTTDKLSVEFNVNLNAQLAIEAGVEAAGTGFSAGYTATLRAEFGESESQTETSTFTTGFSLQDDNTGDDFSVDILTDPVYKTPVFKLRAADTSCPYEEGTRQRDVPMLSAEVPIIEGVAPTGEAEFRLLLRNESETEETRAYMLSFNQQSNTDGASITVGGSPYITPLGPFNIPFGQTVETVVKVGLGASGIFSYEGLEFTLFPECDPGLGETTVISAFFESPCSDVSLFEPNPDWVINSSSNVIAVHIKDYDKSIMEVTDQIKIQYSLKGSSVWLNAKILSRDQLDDNDPAGTNLGHLTTINLSNLDDGEYDIRLALVCGSATIHSLRSEGVIERVAPIQIGIPTPTDDIFIQGTNILTATYDERIECITSDVMITNLTTETMHAGSVSCFQNTITVTPNSTLPDGQYDVVIIDVEDIYGNVSPEFSWMFSIGENQGGGDPGLGDPGPEDCGPINVIANNFANETRPYDGISAGSYYGTLIQSAEIIEPNVTVSFLAESTIELNQGFEVPISTTFIADEGDCADRPDPNAPCNTSIPVEQGNIYHNNTGIGSIEGAGLSCGPGDIMSPGNWYSINGTGEVLTAYFCGHADPNLVIEVFSGICGDELFCVTEGPNDDSTTIGDCTLPPARLGFLAESGTTYYILVRGQVPTDMIDYSLIIEECDTPSSLNDIYCNKIYVDASADGNNNGTSWNNAYINLQDALDDATSGHEIWIAKGRYYTDQGSSVSEGDRNSSFIMKDDVLIAGGFAGFEPSDFDMNQRNLVANETILTGDIGIQGDREDNSYHVINSANNDLTSSAILDGVTVTSGYADGTGNDRLGGGMIIVSSNPTIRNTIFTANFAIIGGGIYTAITSSGDVINSVFIGNDASTAGGGICLGGAYNINHCSFSGNRSLHPTIPNSSNGNAIRIFSSGFSSSISNSIFWGNGTPGTSDVIIASGSFFVNNCIVDLPGGAIYPGTGNINGDPKFVLQPSLLGTTGNLRIQEVSAAIDIINSTSVQTDHDGVQRPIGAKADIGAFEFIP